MSDHAIGHGMNTVTEEVLKLFDQGTLTRDMTEILLRTMIKAVEGWDGNADEAMEAFDEQGRCGHCFKQTKKRNMFDLYKLESNGKNVCGGMAFGYDKEFFVAFNELCESCVDELFTKRLQKPALLKSTKKAYRLTCANDPRQPCKGIAE